MKPCFGTTMLQCPGHFEDPKPQKIPSPADNKSIYILYIIIAEHNELHGVESPNLIFLNFLIFNNFEIPIREYDWSKLYMNF